MRTDEFAIPGSTLPIDINAAYSPDTNGIEIPAAFLQPPFYDAKADAAVNYCTLGAVIGHEITHGFDSSGRCTTRPATSATGGPRPTAKQFVGGGAEAGHAGAMRSRCLPGLHLNGALAVGENLADVGGVSLGYAALQTLPARPSRRRTGRSTASRRAALLPGLGAALGGQDEGGLRFAQVAASRRPSAGALPHVRAGAARAGFYEAFGIRAGDPMWLDEAKRVVIW